MDNYWKQGKCLVCDETVIEVLDLGRHALANALINDSIEKYESYNLGFSSCKKCSHGQLTWMINPDILFLNYLYASGTSGTLNNYFKWLANQLSNYFPAASSVLDIASNDGSFLKCLIDEGFDTQGIDPAKNLTTVANTNGLETICGYFPADMPSDAKFDCITAMNVIAHNPKPQKFMAGINKHLKKNGLAIIQVSQTNMLGRGEFDTIYHEHYSFFTPASMKALAEGSGLKVTGKNIATIHGDSMIYVISHEEHENKTISFKGEFSTPFPSPVPNYLHDNFPETSVETYYNFSLNAKKVMSETGNLIESYRKKGYQVALIGVAAKAMTFIRSANLEFEIYYDEAKLKVGKFVPGSQTPILPFSSIAKIDKKTVFFIGAWNFSKEIKHKAERLLPVDSNSLAHVFITSFPELCEI